MNFCDLRVGFAFILLAIAGVSNILQYAIDEKYVVFGQLSEENPDEERVEEKNLN